MIVEEEGLNALEGALGRVFTVGCCGKFQVPYRIPLPKRSWLQPSVASVWSSVQVMDVSDCRRKHEPVGMWYL